jgi:hypothetical protein
MIKRAHLHKIIAAWLITVPASALLGALFFMPCAVPCCPDRWRPPGVMAPGKSGAGQGGTSKKRWVGPCVMNNKQET